MQKQQIIEKETKRFEELHQKVIKHPLIYSLVKSVKMKKMRLITMFLPNY